jgi:beta-lactamase regulating signal transducer with metallopeptidase domain
VIDTLLTPGFMQRLAGSLLHFFWQGAFIAMLTAVVLQLLGRRSAQSRYAVCVAGLVLMAAAPFATFVFYQDTGRTTERALMLLSIAVAETGHTASASGIQFWAQWIVLGWFAGVGACLARLAVAWRFSRTLVRSGSESVPAAVVQMFESILQQLNIRKGTRLLMSVHIPMPAVVGWLRPAVLLPICAVTNLTQHQLRAVLAHELAHIRRHDFLINTLQRFVESVLFYHPAVWWLSARTRRERENCCDDLAIQTCGDALSYAEALIALERTRPMSEPSLVLGATGGPLTQRIRRLLGHDTTNLDWQSAAVALGFVITSIAAGLWQASPVIAAPPMLATAGFQIAAAPLPQTSITASQTVNAIAAILTAQPVQFAQTSQTAPPSATSKGTIQGMVTRAGSSEPIPGAFVAITNAPFDPDALKTLLAHFAQRGITMDPQEPSQSDDKYFQALMDKINARGISVSLPENQIAIMQFRQVNTARYSAMADANGQFTIRDLAPGQYTLEAGRPGFFDNPGNQTIASVEAGKAVTAAVPLRPGATITGRVKSAVGKLLPNTTVTAFLITYINGKIVPQAQASQTTDDRGEYRLFWLPPGDYALLADPPRYPLSPVPQALVPATGIGPGAAPPQVTLATPPFTRTFYPQALTTTEAQFLSIKGGDQLSGMDITVQKARTYKISGEIHAVPLAAPAQGARANAAPNANAPQGLQVYLGIEYRDPSTVDMRSTNLGGAVPSAGSAVLAPTEDGFRGTFEVRDILPGQYYIVPRTLAGAINRITVDVRDRDVTGLSLEVFRGVNVAGTLTVDGQAPGKVTARVALNPVGNPSPTYQGVTSRAVIANADDGSFTIANIPPTRYMLEMGPGLPADLYVADVRAGGLGVFDSGFEVGKEPPFPLQVMLRSGAATVEGVVRDGTGKPVSNATVVLVPPEARRENRELYKSGKSDASGKFVVRGIAPGSYKLFAFQGIAGGEFYNARFLAKYEFSGRPITVSQNGTATETLTVIEYN